MVICSSNDTLLLPHEQAGTLEAYKVVLLGDVPAGATEVSKRSTTHTTCR